ncbi:MAG TPA: T9SS type A sorting domain-containing protein [Bacteroidia bacterium]|jgi:hypothetical protein|nr:T9SS type A sorting domain-containing protein [Bacteroidia bacterium]
MTKIKLPFLFFFLLFTPFLPLKAQHRMFELGMKPGNVATASCITYDSAGFWLSAGNYKDASFYGTPAYVMKMDTTGQASWFVTPVQAAFTYTDYCEIRDMIRTSDGNIVIAGLFHVCGQPQGGGFMQKLDQTGALKWSKAYYAKTNSQDIPFTHIRELKSKRLCLTADTLVYFAKSTGDSIWCQHYNTGKLYGVEENHLHQLIVATAKGILKLDTLGNKIASYPFAARVESISQNSDSSYVIVSGGNVVRLDTSFAVVTSSSLTSTFASVARLRIRNGSYLLAGKDTVSGNVRLSTYTPQLVLQHTHTWATNQMKVYDADASAVQVIAGGMETTSYNSDLFIKAFNDTLFGGIDSTNIGVLKVYIDSNYSTHPVINPPSYYDIHFKSRVTIKNFGNDTVRTIILNTYLGPGAQCKPDLYTNRFPILLAPGDTLQLMPGWLVATGVHYTSPFASHTFNSCFWTSLPNSITDKDHTNDMQCQSFVTPYPVGTGILEYSLQDLISVFPNPARTAFTVQLPEQGTEHYRLMLYTPGGQLVQSQTTTGNSLITCDVSTLASGMYFLEVQGLVSGERAFKKVIVE